MPRVKENMPILARRQGTMRLWHPSQGQLETPFGAINSNFGVFGVTARAFCGAGQRHPAPDPGCGCGFYSVPLDLPLFNQSRNDLFEMLVELSGTVVEHTRGFRAYHQRVLEIRLPRCQDCGERRDRVSYLTKTGQVMDSVHLACRPYVRELHGVEVMSLEDATRVLGVPLVHADG